MKELILKKIALRKRWSLGLFITCLILMWAGLFILLYYTSRDDNSYLHFPLFLILFICLLFSTLGIFMFKFFKSYITTLNELSEKESSMFVEQGTSRPFAEQWMPSFIIYQGKVKFFKLFKQPEYDFADIKAIQFKRFNFTKSRQDCRINIQLINGIKHYFHVNGNLSQRTYLKNEALACNPKIIIDDQYD
ncbi:hypothetical protein SAMN05421664_3241 [Chryseobacterium soldanellicola]|uniref:Uncharacterized protein n=1 Tax=Chryseobacterium soldanellicola TaxID=311333 RepID=A0A1H1FSN2_9FLAO|nr:hypothetical protein [Chryseobacterium soldanellicola]SDR03947.1 hypothetical protein SAMN05421664_3241 [Chryseobacterium soldanellicola]